MNTSRRTPRTRLTRAACAAAAAALVLPLAACGEEEAGPTDERTTATSAPQETHPTTTPETPTTPAAGAEVAVVGDAGAHLVALVQGSKAGGRAQNLATSLADEQDLADFVAPLSKRLGRQVAKAADRAVVVDGQEVYAAVVGIGCEPPTSVSVDTAGDAYAVTAQQPKPTVQCLVPVTYVLVFTTPSAL